MVFLILFLLVFMYSGCIQLIHHAITVSFVIKKQHEKYKKATINSSKLRNYYGAHFEQLLRNKIGITV